MRTPPPSNAKLTLRCACGKDVQVPYPGNGLTRATCAGCGACHWAMLRGQRVCTGMGEKKS
jgi:hypothetical protein